MIRILGATSARARVLAVVALLALTCAAVLLSRGRQPDADAKPAAPALPLLVRMVAMIRGSLCWNLYEEFPGHCDQNVPAGDSIGLSPNWLRCRAVCTAQ